MIGISGKRFRKPQTKIGYLVKLVRTCFVVGLGLFYLWVIPNMFGWVNNPPVKDHETFKLEGRPVSVEAVLTNNEDYWECFIVLRQRDTEEVVRTTIQHRDGGQLRRRDLYGAIRHLVRTKGDYIFVREDNGGGNAWRADVDHVFTLYKGWLVRLGSLCAHLADVPGEQFHDGLFEDVYDRLEFNDLTCHRGAPRFNVMMEDTGAELAVNVPLTWAAAQKHYRESHRILEEGPRRKGYGIMIEQDEETRESALFCLALTTYCGQEAAYDADHELVREIYGDGAAAFEAEVERITPGELPSAFADMLKPSGWLSDLLRDSSSKAADREAAESVALPTLGARKQHPAKGGISL